MKKKILFIYDSMMLGGTTTALLSLIESIDRNKYEIDILLYTNTGTNFNKIPNFVHILPEAYIGKKFLSSRNKKIVKTIFSRQLIEAVISYFKYRNTPKGKFRGILMHYGMRAQVSLSRVIEEEYDVAIGFMEGWSAQYIASPKIKALKKYIWIHPQYKSCYLIPEIDRKNFETVDKIVLVSESCVEQFNEFFPEFRNKIAVIPNIISSNILYEKAFSKMIFIEKKEINFCTVCRCDLKVKGLDRLLKTFYKLKMQSLCKNVKWHLIGDGPDYKYLESEVDRLDLRDVIVFYGEQSNPLPYLSQMDIFVLASRYEGKPLSVTEAQILGVPCLITNYASAKSQVQNEYDGLVVENSFDGIYNGVKRIIENPELLNKWKENMKTKNYGNEQDVVKFYNLINS